MSQQQQFLEGACSTEDIAKNVARMWKGNPNSFMQLRSYVREADDDGDGLISKDEFRKLLDKSGLGNMSDSEARALFAKVDKDGDGDLTMAELKQIAEMGRGKVKAQN